jgi:RNA-directed DNA polymerase
LKVKANKGSYGIDKVNLEEFEKDLKKNLYRIWNRMSSGSYFPPPVKLVEIEKKSGGMRPLGIPTVGDRVAQMVCKMYLEPKLEPVFHEDSYGYRPKKSALDAVGKARERCWRYDWVVDLDIKGFFDNINHELMMKAVKHHTDLAWILIYVKRWLTAPLELEDGTLKERFKGTPQGGVVSPLLANLFLHYAFDEWMKRNYPYIPFERYADDCIVHCRTEKQARYIKDMINRRMNECHLKLHPEKTKIVYCKDEDRREEYSKIQFDFLGYTFKPRTCKNRKGKLFINFLPAISQSSIKSIKEKLRLLKLRKWTDRKIQYIAKVVNARLIGWLNYYGRFYKSKLYPVFFVFDCILIKWARNKYKNLRRSWTKAYKWLGKIASKNPKLFIHWQLGLRPKV